MAEKVTDCMSRQDHLKLIHRGSPNFRQGKQIFPCLDISFASAIIFELLDCSLTTKISISSSRRGDREQPGSARKVNDDSFPFMTSLRNLIGFIFELNGIGKSHPYQPSFH